MAAGATYTKIQSQTLGSSKLLLLLPVFLNPILTLI